MDYISEWKKELGFKEGSSFAWWEYIVYPPLIIGSLILTGYIGYRGVKYILGETIGDWRERREDEKYRKRQEKREEREARRREREARR